MKNIYGVKAFKGRSSEHFKKIEKKIGNNTKLAKSNLFVHSLLILPNKVQSFNKNNNYYLVENRKNCINLPLIFPKKNYIYRLRKKINPINFSGSSESSFDKVINFSFKNHSLSYSNNSSKKNLNSYFSAQTILQSLDSLRNEYKSASKKIHKFQKTEKNFYDNATLKYQQINHKLKLFFD